MDSGNPTGDRELLRQFAATGSQGAFAAIVERHASLVYGIACRKLRDHHAAEDVTQAVFLVLAKKAARLGRETVLGAWLVRVAVYESAQWQRAKRRRQIRETKLMASSSTTNSLSAAEQEERQRLIDEALARVGPTDRRAVVLRYLHGMSNQDAAAVLGITENACKQRVCRGLEKMRQHLAARGITASAGALASMVPVMLTSHPAPAHLVSSIPIAIHAASSAALCKGGLLVMASTKAKIGVAAATGFLLVGTAVVVSSRANHTNESRDVLQPMPVTPVSGPGLAVRPFKASGEVPDGMVRREVVAEGGQKMTVVSPKNAPTPQGQPTYQILGRVDQVVTRVAQQPPQSK